MHPLNLLTGRFKVLPLIDFLSKKIEFFFDATTCLEHNKRRAERIFKIVQNVFLSFDIHRSPFGLVYLITRSRSKEINE